MAELLQPEQIYWCDGSDEENNRLLDECVQRGSAIELNPAKRPG